jgi:hypothetical protein
MLEGILFFLIGLLTFVFIPFTGSLLVPTSVRIIVLLFLVICFIGISIKKKNVFYFMVGYLPMALVLAILWYKSSPQSISPILYFLTFVLFSVGLYFIARRLPMLAYLLSRLLLWMVIIISLQAIGAFLAFNLNLAPFTSIKLGDFEYYLFYYNPIFGYISPKKFSDIIIGRVAGFMFEPSYMAWFLVTNFFLLGKLIKQKGVPLLVARCIVFLGAMATVSTASWIVFGLIFMVKVFYWILEKLGASPGVSNKIVGIFMVIGIIGVLSLPKEQLNNSLGNSSFGDRDERVQNSLFILATSGVTELLMGHSPGYIEGSDIGKGESNQYMKLIVEEGLLITLLVVWSVIYCTKGNKYYMLANLVFLSSVVVLLTPLFIVNILICKWCDDGVI